MYIKALSCISPQHTFDGDFFKFEPIDYFSKQVEAIEPNYNELIPKGLLRRMGKGVRMGIGTGITLLKEYPNVEGIIIGTANGGLEDCIKFLNQIVEYKEGTLTPTNFVQSTPNAVAANLALMTNNISYNSTHVNTGLAFESALMDAFLTLEEQAGPLLVGSLEEISSYNINIDTLKGWVKSDDETLSLLTKSNTKGSVPGEGACMFIIDKSKENAQSFIRDFSQITTKDENVLFDFFDRFLKNNNLSIEEVDGFMLGLNGDSNCNYFYDLFINRYIQKETILTFKNCVGEYPTSMSFAVWLSTELINGNNIKLVEYQAPKAKYQRILIYNHYFGLQHSFMIIEKPI